MPIKEVIASQRVPIKIWTDEVDDRYTLKQVVCVKG